MLDCSVVNFITEIFRKVVDSSVIRPYLPHVVFMKHSDSLLPICQTRILARYSYP